MPVQVTYPGVYIEELPSGQRTITGVATSITAFVGRALYGPINEPITIFTYGEFESMFGGLSYNYPMSYAVQDFFLNGGGQAVIVRLVGANAKKATLTLGGGTLEAASEGTWSNNNNLQVVADQNNLPDFTKDTLIAARYARNNIQQSDLFNITVAYTDPRGQVSTERFTNLTLKDAPNRIDRVLAAESNLVRVAAKSSAPASSGSTSGAAESSTTATSTPPSTAMVVYSPNLPTAVPTAVAKSNNDGADGDALISTDYTGSQEARTGIYALEHVDLFNLLCIPQDQRDEDIDPEVYGQAAGFCYQRRAILIIDSPSKWTHLAKTGQISEIQATDLNINNEPARNAAVYFPRVMKEDLEMGGQVTSFPACGIISGIIAATDVRRGVWKAPAGQDAGLNGIAGLEFKLTDKQNGQLNPLGINCLRTFPVLGTVVWGARTLRGADQLSDDYKYLPVRRLTLYIEESLYRGTQWAVFEPNDETLWSTLRLSVGSFMADLARQGAFYGYQVVCDKTTTTQSDIDHGIVHVLVAFAPVKPAEFVVIQIRQQAGQNPA